MKWKKRANSVASRWHIDAILSNWIRKPGKGRGWARGYIKVLLCKVRCYLFFKTEIKLSDAWPHPSPFSLVAWHRMSKSYLQSGCGNVPESLISGKYDIVFLVFIYSIILSKVELLTVEQLNKALEILFFWKSVTYCWKGEHTVKFFVIFENFGKVNNKGLLVP